MTIKTHFQIWLQAAIYARPRSLFRLQALGAMALLGPACSSGLGDAGSETTNVTHQALRSTVTLSIPSGVTFQQVVVSGARFSLNDGARIVSSPLNSPVSTVDGAAVTATSSGASSIGVNASGPNLVSVGDVNVRGSTVGWLTTQGHVNAQAGSQIARRREQATLSPLQTLNLDFESPSAIAGKDVILQPEQSRTLAPGGYDHVIVNSGATLVLSGGGGYSFNQLDLEPGAVLDAVSAQEIDVTVNSSLLFRGQLQTFDKFLMVYKGAADVFLEAPFSGMFVATQASLGLRYVHPLATASDVAFSGQFFAAGIVTVFERVGVEHRPFSRTRNNCVGVASDLKEISAYPSSQQEDLANDMQGIAHDSKFWYFTNSAAQFRGNSTHIWRRSLTSDLGQGLSEDIVIENPWSSFDHFGALTNDGAGHLLVPLEGDDRRGALGVFNAATLEGVGFADLPSAQSANQDPDSDQGEGAPWASFNAADQHVYSSSFTARFINAYSVTSTSLPITIKRTGTKEVRDCQTGYRVKVSAAQGAVFGPSGNLYMVTDLPYLPGSRFGVGPGVLILDKNAFVVDFISVPKGGDSDELEGIDIIDLDSGKAPGIKGQLHVMMVDNNNVFSDDSITLRHFRGSNL